MLKEYLEKTRTSRKDWEDGLGRMPNEITDGYQIECLLCSYVWKTKYSQISAKCPSCNSRIYGTENYTVHTRYIHYEKTEEEKKRTRRTISLTLLGFMFFISFMANWIFGLFLFSALWILVFYFGYREPKETKIENKLKNEKLIKFFEDKEEVKTTLTCPKCGRSFNYTHKIGKEGNLIIRCNHCKSKLNISTDLTTEFKCEYCGKKFKTKTETENHEKGCKKKK